VIGARGFSRALLTLVLLAAPRAALACPVCFGNSDSPLAVAMNMGIFMMLIVVAGMLAAFAYFFVYLMRRAKMVAAKEMTEGIAQ
jgi:hypothetical protein